MDPKEKEDTHKNAPSPSSIPVFLAISVIRTNVQQTIIPYSAGAKTTQTDGETGGRGKQSKEKSHSKKRKNFRSTSMSDDDDESSFASDSDDDNMDAPSSAPCTTQLLTGNQFRVMIEQDILRQVATQRQQAGKSVAGKGAAAVKQKKKLKNAPHHLTEEGAAEHYYVKHIEEKERANVLAQQLKHLRGQLKVSDQAEREATSRLDKLLESENLVSTPQPAGAKVKALLHENAALHRKVHSMAAANKAKSEEIRCLTLAAARLQNRVTGQKMQQPGGGAGGGASLGARGTREEIERETLATGSHTAFHPSPSPLYASEAPSQARRAQHASGRGVGASSASGTSASSRLSSPLSSAGTPPLTPLGDSLADRAGASASAAAARDKDGARGTASRAKGGRTAREAPPRDAATVSVAGGYAGSSVAYLGSAGVGGGGGGGLPSYPPPALSPAQRDAKLWRKTQKIKTLKEDRQRLDESSKRMTELYTDCLRRYVYSRLLFLANSRKRGEGEKRLQDEGLRFQKEDERQRRTIAALEDKVTVLEGECKRFRDSAASLQGLLNKANEFGANTANSKEAEHHRMLSGHAKELEAKDHEISALRKEMIVKERDWKESMAKEKRQGASSEAKTATLFKRDVLDRDDQIARLQKELDNVTSQYRALASENTSVLRSANKAMDSKERQASSQSARLEKSSVAHKTQVEALQAEVVRQKRENLELQKRHHALEAKVDDVKKEREQLRQAGKNRPPDDDVDDDEM